MFVQYIYILAYQILLDISLNDDHVGLCELLHCSYHGYHLSKKDNGFDMDKKILYSLKD